MVSHAHFAMIKGEDQWRRVAHENTSLGVETGVVQLAWQLEQRIDEPTELPAPVGLAFDPWCRLYHGLVQEGQVERMLWAAKEPLRSETVELFSQPEQQVGDFTKQQARNGGLNHPGSMVVDEKGRLFIVEEGEQRILIYDLVDKRLLRILQLPQPIMDLATDGSKVYVLLSQPFAIAAIDTHAGPWYEDVFIDLELPSRLAIRNQQLFVLNAAGSDYATVYPMAYPDDSIEVPYASDIEFTAEGTLVVARSAGEDFLRFHVEEGLQWQLPHLKAILYDGKGIVRTPDDHIGYWTDKGFTHASLARVKYVKQGKLTSFRLDSGEFQTAWGRVFIDACIPKGTSVRIACLALDEVPEDMEQLPRTPPENTLAVTIHRPDLSPPMPPRDFIEKIPLTQLIHKRSTGYEMPWLCRDKNNPFQTYEAPVISGQGRYLWLAIELNGTTRTTPRIKSVRVEYPAHDLLHRLPQFFSQQLQQADFLRRYLAMPEGFLRELDQQSSLRHILLNPAATPVEALPWLGAFMGLVLDERWSQRAKRQLIHEANWLFRYRGTVMGLKRFIEIYLDMQIQIIEHFKVRGLGGAFVGEDASLDSRAILGAGFRIGGRLDEIQQRSINKTTILDAFASHAHRFSVVIPALLDTEQQSVLEHILEVHRPAHTLYDICSVDSGMRAGRSLYAGMNSIVGYGAGFGRLQVNGSLLGRNDVLGIPASGTRIGNNRIGRDSRVG